MKGLLRSDQKAFFGHFRKNNQFYWDDNKPYSPYAYRGWKTGEPYYDYAVITRDGWEATYLGKELNYVCQIFAKFSNPTLNCETMKIGAAFPPLTCSVDVHESFGSFYQLEVQNSQHNPLIKCSSNYGCQKSVDFVSAQISQDRTSMTATITVDRKVTRSDDRIQWVCDYRFTKTPTNFLFNSCTMQVYNAPTSLRCEHTISEDILILCETEGVYPEAESYMNHYINDNLSGKWTWINPKHEHYIDNNLPFYKSKFEKRISDQLAEGNHRVEIFVFPRVSFPTETKRREASESHSFNFVIAVPYTPPTFTSGNALDLVDGKLIAREGMDVRLVCNVNGGMPPVFETKIVCEAGATDAQGRNNWHSQNQRAEATISVTREMTQRRCKCSATHITQQYKETSTLELDIQYPAETSGFTLNGNKDDEVEIREGEMINFQCSAKGNPVPAIHIVHVYNNGESTKYIGNQTHTEELSINVKASGDMSGVYLCSARNNLNRNEHIRKKHLMVKCAPRPCSQRDYDRQFSARQGHDVQLEMCVYAYPPITTLELARNTHLRKEDYDVSFKYIEPDEAKAIITVTVRAPEVYLEQFTLHTIQQDLGRSEFSFNLVPFQKPSCPVSLDTTLVGNRFVTLSWQPAFDRGLPQTFILSTVNGKGDVLYRQDVIDDGQKVMSHNASDLDSGSRYRFKLTVRNDQGETDCPHLVVNVTTLDMPAAERRSEDVTVGMIILIVIAILIILIAIALLVLVILKRKRESSTEDKQIYAEMAETSDGKSNRCRNKGIQGEHATTSKAQENAYAEITKRTTAVESNASNPYQISQNSFEETNSANTKGKKPHPSPRKSRALDMIDNTYANCEQATNQNKRERTNQEEEGQTTKGAKEKKKAEKVKAMKEATKGPPACGSSAPRSTVVQKESNKELVYIEVEIVPKKEGLPTKRLEINPTQEESVAYASVNFNASVGDSDSGEAGDHMQTVL